jgi:hypothetical protein
VGDVISIAARRGRGRGKPVSPAAVVGEPIRSGSAAGLLEGRLEIAIEALRRVMAWTERDLQSDTDAEMVLAAIGQEADVGLRLLVDLTRWRSGNGKVVRMRYDRRRTSIVLELLTLGREHDAHDRVQVERAMEALGEWAAMAADGFPRGGQSGDGTSAMVLQQDALLTRLRSRAQVAMPGYRVEITETSGG